MLMIYDSSSLFSRQSLIAVLGLLFFMFCAYIFFDMKITTDEEKIQSTINFRLFQISQQVYWRDVRRIDADYLVNPDVLTKFTLQASNSVNFIFKKYKMGKMEILIALFPADLLTDIFSKIPSLEEAKLNPILKNRFVRRYGADVVEKFDNIGKDAHAPVPKGGIFTARALTGFLKTYIIVLIGFILYNRFWGHILDGDKELFGSLVFAFFGSLTYYIYWWLFGGNID